MVLVFKSQVYNILGCFRYDMTNRKKLRRVHLHVCFWARNLRAVQMMLGSLNYDIVCYLLCITIHLSIHPSIHPSIYLSIYLSVFCWEWLGILVPSLLGVCLTLCFSCSGRPGGFPDEAAMAAMAIWLQRLLFAITTLRWSLSAYRDDGHHFFVPIQAICSLPLDMPPCKKKAELPCENKKKAELPCENMKVTFGRTRDM